MKNDGLITKTIRPILLRFIYDHGAAVACLAILAVFLYPHWSQFTSYALMRQMAVLTLLGLGLMVELLCGDQDLSITAHTAMITVVFAGMVKAGVPVWLAVMGGLISGLILGALKGWMFSVIKVPSLILTVALKMILEGGIGAVFPNIYLERDLSGSLPERIRLWGIALGAVLVLAVFLWYILNRTYIGKYCHLIGENYDTMRRSGVPCTPVIVLMHMLAACFFTGAALLMVLTTGSGSASMGSVYLFQVFTAVCIGGVSLLGGRGRVLGVLIGCAVMVLLHQMIICLGLLGQIEVILYGIIILLSVLWQVRNGHTGFTRKPSPLFRR